MEEHRTMKVFFEDNPEQIEIHEQLIGMSGLLKELLVFANEAIKLSITFEIFKKFVEFCKINNFKDDMKIFKVKTNDLRQALIGEEKNYEFISQYKGRQDPNLVRLFKGAEYLRCEPLIKLIAAVVACDFYFEDNTAAYEKIKERLGVKEEITFHEDEEYNRTYYFMQ